jgi:hypothetical protein
MRKTLGTLLDLFKELHDWEAALQPRMRECLHTLYRLGRKKSLTARGHRRPGGALRAIYLSARSRKSFRYIGGRKIRLCLHIREAPINYGVISKIAHDMEHASAWISADAVRRRLNRQSATYAVTLRDLRMALANKFASQVTDADRALVLRLQGECPYLTREDAPAVLGAVVYDRLLRDLEGRISALVLQWKDQMKTLPFEPLIRWRASGPLRLTWAYVDRFYDAGGGIQVRSHDIPGGVTDLWLRQHHTDGGASGRKEILRYAAPLRTLTREYSRLLVYAGRLKARVRRTLSPEINVARPVAGAEAI